MWALDVGRDVGDWELRGCLIGLGRCLSWEFSEEHYGLDLLEFGFAGEHHGWGVWGLRLRSV